MRAMGKNTFPTLLTTRATMLGPLTRNDLCFAGAGYILLSILNLSGILSLLVIVAGLIGLRHLRRVLPRGFFTHLTDATDLQWAKNLKGVRR